jgi:ubiquinone/menaquinone biosynthesis C-methylase UbiE
VAETHEIVLVEQKPSSESIQKQIESYFDMEAKTYNAFTETSEKRKLYLASIDQIIANSLKDKKIKKLISIACGTGRREIGIRRSMNYDFDITGVDVSDLMCEEANKAGLNTIHSSWINANLNNSQFDAGLYLHSFGLVSTRADRQKEIKKIANHLSMGASFFIDVLNLDDENEWGPKIKQLYQKNNLKSRGYDSGDVFYRKIGGTEISFFHYFTESEITNLLTTNGFKVEKINFIGYGKKFGEKVPSDQGSILIQAIKI